MRQATEFEQVWTERLEVGWERATTVGTTTTTSLQGPVGAGEVVAGIERRLEETLKNRVALAGEKHQRSGKTLEATVPAGKILLVTLEWKQVWHPCAPPMSNVNI
ncbi:hypothetical protein ABZ752_03185 [Streptomyces roseifaciens]